MEGEIKGGAQRLVEAAASPPDGAGEKKRTTRHRIRSVVDQSAVGVAGCDAPLSARELAHAAIAYARPIGNVDPDTDPAGTVNLAPLTVR